MDVCELGFVVKADDPRHLTSPFFPSKLGGKPAWLDPLNLPSSSDLLCGVCKKTLTFLLQVYAPSSDRDKVNAFHRTIFVFMCRDPSCHQYKDNHAKCFKVLRCQLRELNDFYNQDECQIDAEVASTVSSDLEQLKINQSESSKCKSLDNLVPLCAASSPISECPVEVHVRPVNVTPSDSEEAEVVKCKPASSITASSGASLPSLCVVCGIRGPKRCAKCQTVNYCSRDHQIHDWKSGHKLFCTDLASGQSTSSSMEYDPSVGVALPLFEIVTELEPDVSLLEKQPERTVEERMAEYYKYVQARNIDVSKEETRKSKHGEASNKKSDKQFKVFKKRVALEPEQVIRYQLGGVPLLVSSEGVPCEGGIPPCQCGAKRVFELQVMPQLLYYLSMDVVSGPSVDWGTLLIYTCADSCTTGAAYHEEFLLKQDFST